LQKSPAEQAVQNADNDALLLSRFGTGLLNIYKHSAADGAACVSACAGGMGLDNSQSVARSLKLDAVVACGVLPEVQDLRSWAQEGTTTVLSLSMNLISTLQRARSELKARGDAIPHANEAWPIVTCLELMSQPTQAHSSNIVLQQAYLSQCIGSGSNCGLGNAKGFLFVATNAHCKSIKQQEKAAQGVGHAWCVFVRRVTGTTRGDHAILLEVYDSLPDLHQKTRRLSLAQAASRLDCVPGVPDIVMHVVISELAPAWFGSDACTLVSYSGLFVSPSGKRAALEASPPGTTGRQMHAKQMDKRSIAASQARDPTMSNSCVWMAMWHAHLLQQAAIFFFQGGSVAETFSCEAGKCHVTRWKSAQTGHVQTILVAQNSFAELLTLKRFAIQLVSCMAAKIPRAVPVKPLWANLFFKTVEAFIAEFESDCAAEPARKAARA